jgi:predicted RNase H-like nuclease (RuvC/YqgF family)
MAATADIPDLSAYHEKSRKVLLAVHAATDDDEDKASTGDIREHSGLAGNLVWNHAQRLVSNGLLEEAGRDESSNAPIAPNVYRLTERGRSAARNHIEDDSLPTDARLSRLESEVATLRAERDELQEMLSDYEGLPERVTQLETRFEELRARLGSKKFVEDLRQRLSA